VFAYLQDQYRSIYGADTYLEPDSQDGQMIGVFAKAISDVNSVVIATYRSFGTINQIATPARGWQSVTNPADAAEGAPVEKDPVLRQRQTVSTALPSLTVLDGIIGAVANVPGVTRYVAYENDTSAADANGIPSHSISLVVEGGDATAIANAIAAKKTPGSGTYMARLQSSSPTFTVGQSRSGSSGR
jgi:uncharacterized phage protein gp47/JayE